MRVRYRLSIIDANVTRRSWGAFLLRSGRLFLRLGFGEMYVLLGKIGRSLPRNCINVILGGLRPYF